MAPPKIKNKSVVHQKDTIVIFHHTTHLRAREETFDGKDFLVVPVVMMNVGVHHGSGGPILYTAHELGIFPEAWNGVPLPVFHPEDNEGLPVSANSPQIIQSQSVGHIFNVEFVDNELRGEAWVDVDKAQRISPEILDMIENNESIEVSTGLFSEDQRKDGEFEGESFIAVAHNIRPDHLALLPGQVGACSLADGCGIRFNSKSSSDQVARRPVFSGSERRSWGNVCREFRCFREGFYKYNGGRPEDKKTVPKNFKQAPLEMKKWISNLCLLPNEKATKLEDFALLPVINPATLRVNRSALQSILDKNEGTVSVTKAAYTSAQRMAQSLLRNEFDVESESEDISTAEAQNLFKALAEKIPSVAHFYANIQSHGQIRQKLQRIMDQRDVGGLYHFVRHVYNGFFVFMVEGPEGDDRTGLFQQSYTVDGDDNIIPTDNIQKVREEVSFISINNQNEGDVMNKEEKIKAILANTSFTEADKDMLNGMTDSHLDNILTANKKDETLVVKPVAQTAVQVNNQVGFNELLAKADPATREAIEGGIKMHTDKKNALITSILTNKQNTFTKEGLEAMDFTAIEAIAKMATPEHSYVGAMGGPVINTNPQTPVVEPMGSPWDVTETK